MVQSVKATRAGVEELIVVSRREYRVEDKSTEVDFWINEWNFVMCVGGKKE